MFEAQGKNHPEKIAVLEGSQIKGIKVDPAEARKIVEDLTCLDPSCTAPLLVVRGNPNTRAHFRHRSGSGEGCVASSPEGEWHLAVKLGVLEAAFAHEHSIAGARVDAVVKRRSGTLVAMEVQHSPIDTETVLRRHAAHRAAGILGTIWLVDAKHLSADMVVRTRWVMDLILACRDTPLTPQGEAQYGCTVAFIKIDADPEIENVLTFVDRVDTETKHGREMVRLLTTATVAHLDSLKVWAAGEDRPTEVSPHLASELRVLDAAPTRRVKGPAVIFTPKGKRS